MHRIIVMLVVLGAAMASSHRRRNQGFGHLNGWQKVFGMLAFVAAVLILLNPETFALGLLGDTAFFDILVLTLNVQILSYASAIWARVRVFKTRLPRFPLPSPGLRCLMVYSAVIFFGIWASIQRFVHRLTSLRHCNLSL
jgi:hypothetical protein